MAVPAIFAGTVFSRACAVAEAPVIQKFTKA